MIRNEGFLYSGLFLEGGFANTRLLMVQYTGAGGKFGYVMYTTYLFDTVVLYALHDPESKYREQDAVLIFKTDDLEFRTEDSNTGDWQV